MGDRDDETMSDADAGAPDDERDPAAAGVAHLQRAGREFVSAARSFLDAVEEVVEDRTRLGELAESFTGFLGELSDAARGGSAPWGSPVRPTAPDDAETATAPESAAGTDPVPSTGTADERPQPGARVRRIPVD
ncbi:MAG: hypothetical protein ACOYML_04180 [Microthrixaceae bacterium]